jgi:hypothetical protein
MKAFPFSKERIESLAVIVDYLPLNFYFSPAKYLFPFHSPCGKAER